MLHKKFLIVLSYMSMFLLGTYATSEELGKPIELYRWVFQIVAFIYLVHLMKKNTK